MLQEHTMNEERHLGLLVRTGAIMEEGHFVYTSGRHGSVYINKDALYPHTHTVCELAKGVALAFDDMGVEVVAGPEKGGIILAQWVAYWFQKWNVRSRPEVLAVYAEKSEGGFVFRRGYGAHIIGKRVLIPEDILNTGGSAKKMAETVRAAGGEVVGVSAIVNRGNVGAEELDVPLLKSLLTLPQKTYDEIVCPLCANHVPINTTLGHGAAFVEKFGQP